MTYWLPTSTHGAPRPVNFERTWSCSAQPHHTDSNVAGAAFVPGRCHSVRSTRNVTLRLIVPSPAAARAGGALSGISVAEIAVTIATWSAYDTTPDAVSLG